MTAHTSTLKLVVTDTDDSVTDVRTSATSDSEALPTSCKRRTKGARGLQVHSARSCNAITPNRGARPPPA